MFSVGLISLNIKWRYSLVKAFYLLMIDAEKRRWEEEIGLDTQIPPLSTMNGRG